MKAPITDPLLYLTGEIGQTVNELRAAGQYGLAPSLVAKALGEGLQRELRPLVRAIIVEGREGWSTY